MQPESLTDYLARRKKPAPKQPEWIRRMNEGKLPAKDMTPKGRDAA